jgi:hypothetical protein
MLGHPRSSSSKPSTFSLLHALWLLSPHRLEMGHLSCSKEKATSRARFRCERQGMYGLDQPGYTTTILTQQVNNADHLQLNGCAVKAGSP